MLQLTHDTEQLARKIAACVGRRPDDIIRAALEREAQALGVFGDLPVMHRRTVQQMTAIGEKVSALPLLDTIIPERNPRRPA